MCALGQTPVKHVRSRGKLAQFSCWTTTHQFRCISSADLLREQIAADRAGAVDPQPGPGARHLAPNGRARSDYSAGRGADH
jgi:hypothetical protein